MNPNTVKSSNSRLFDTEFEQIEKLIISEFQSLAAQSRDGQHWRERYQSTHAELEASKHSLSTLTDSFKKHTSICNDALKKCQELQTALSRRTQQWELAQTEIRTKDALLDKLQEANTQLHNNSIELQVALQKEDHKVQQQTMAYQQQNAQHGMLQQTTESLKIQLNVATAEIKQLKSKCVDYEAKVMQAELAIQRLGEQKRIVEELLEEKKRESLEYSSRFEQRLQAVQKPIKSVIPHKSNPLVSSLNKKTKAAIDSISLNILNPSEQASPNGSDDSEVVLYSHGLPISSKKPTQIVTPHIPIKQKQTDLTTIKNNSSDSLFASITDDENEDGISNIYDPDDIILHENEVTVSESINESSSKRKKPLSYTLPLVNKKKKTNSLLD